MKRVGHEIGDEVDWHLVRHLRCTQARVPGVSLLSCTRGRREFSRSPSLSLSLSLSPSSSGLSASCRARNSNCPALNRARLLACAADHWRYRVEHRHCQPQRCQRNESCGACQQDERRVLDVCHYLSAVSVHDRSDHCPCHIKWHAPFSFSCVLAGHSPPATARHQASRDPCCRAVTAALRTNSRGFPCCCDEPVQNNEAAGRRHIWLRAQGRQPRDRRDGACGCACGSPPQLQRRNSRGGVRRDAARGCPYYAASSCLFPNAASLLWLPRHGSCRSTAATPAFGFAFLLFDADMLSCGLPCARFRRWPSRR